MDIPGFGFAAGQLSLLVQGAEIILQTVSQTVVLTPHLQNEITEWFCRKEEFVACITCEDISAEISNDGIRTGSSSSCSPAEEYGSGSASPPSERDIEDSEGTDSDEELDEDESDGFNSEALIEHIESTFKNIIDKKIEDTERFFDHKQYALRFVVPNLLKESPIIHPIVVETIHIDTQTDDSSFSSGALASFSRMEPETARQEIAHLRTARDSLVAQRMELSDKIKPSQQMPPEMSDEKKLYEYEEAIEAIDCAIDYKNEIICGRECILSNNLAPGRNEANLMTRLTNLSILDLQRLVCQYFSKVVEMRYSSKRLEKNVEELEASTELLTRRVACDQKHIKEMETEYQKRITSILGYHKQPDTGTGKHVLELERLLAAARNKQYDLERSLTELLYRHGYFLMGADYDVQQVVNKLKIDTAQIGLNWEEDDKKKKQGTAGIPPKVRAKLESGTGGPGISRRRVENYGHRRPAESHDLLQPHVLSHRQSNHHRRHKYRDREPEPPEVTSPVSQVRREKRKLIIQPGQHR